MYPMIVIENADVYGPQALGRKTVLTAYGKILAVRDNLDVKLLKQLGLDYEVIDAKGCYLLPGIIDPQELLCGGSGENGFQSQTPRIELSELIRAGITTVIGCLGADTVTKNLQVLLGRVKGVRAEGLSCYMYTGGYDVPPATITENLRSDIVLIEEILGVGEVAISDYRSSEPTVSELARMVSTAYVAGTLTHKAGITRIHVGDRPTGLSMLRELLKKHDVKAESLYPTHVERTGSLLKEAAAITLQGVTVDIDTVNDDLLESLTTFIDHGGQLSHLTASSDAGINSPLHLYREFRRCVLESKMDLEQLLPIVTTNTARVLKLHAKGRITEGYDADMIIIEKNEFVLRDVIAMGQVMMRNQEIQKKAAFLQDFKREMTG